MSSKRMASTHLEGMPEGSLGAINATQVIEHLPSDRLLAFLRLSHSRLKPGGLFIVETVNPHSIAAFKTFWTDLTHQAPIFPEVALVLCWLQRFRSARVVFLNGSGQLDADRAGCGQSAVVATR